MNDTTEILMIIDKSGSMGIRRDDTIGGFNTFLKDQKKLDKPATMSMVQFDDIYEAHYISKDLKEVPELTTATYVPRGNTALLDAMGRGITELGAKLAAMPEAERPSNVIVVVMTDGAENASKEYTYPRIKDMVELQSTTYKWTFLFLGANIDVLAVGGALGFAAQNSVPYSGTAKSVGRAYSAVSAGVMRSRSASPSLRSAVLLNDDEKKKIADSDKES